MIIKFKQSAKENDIKRVFDFLASHGFSIKDASSDNVKIFGVIGETKKLDEASLLSFNEVASVVRISSPFKEASREFKNDNTIISLPHQVKIGDGNFTVMAGPCSVESEEQLETIVKELVKDGVKIIRGGVFKPRTSPYSFQGLGIEGLKMMRRVCDKYNVNIVTELMSEEYIDEFIKYTDIIQIGARNMQNYDLLKALGKTSKPILLKRGMSATIEEWLMSAEYILSSGNPNVILCERGIRTFEKYTRNTLDISAALAVKNLSHLPVIIDPSHAAGRHDMIEGLSLASLAVGADGIIVEVHHDPERALSDGPQSLKPVKFHLMMNKLRKLSSALDIKVQ